MIAIKMRRGPNMIVIWVKRGLNMIAITNQKRTIYDCNPFQLGPNMIAISEIVLESCDYDFWTNLAKTKFRLLQSYLVPIWKDCNLIWSALNWWLQSYLILIWSSMQSYLGLLVMKIAIIFGPHDENYFWRN